ncbi:MAG: YabP/YqfC family sporulation protein [Clostridia bacterium]|nr:YabP/YqfC family sporulation protein [Clostridia bacterium]
MAKFKFKTNSQKKKLNIFRFNGVTDTGRNLSAPRIEIISNREFSLDGCLGIIEYNDVYVRVKVPRGEITVMGVSLDIPIFDGPIITVKGKIHSVELNMR